MTLPPDAPPGHDRIDEDSPVSTPEASKKQEWVPTETALNKFLDALNPDLEKSAAEYEKLRTRLIRFFEWRGCSLPETRADQTIDRAMRKLDEGRVMTNLKGFVFAIARRIAKEDWRADHAGSLDDESTIRDTLTPDPAKKLESEEEPDRQLICFDHCLESMSPKSRNLILSYYKEDGRAKIDWRKQLAKQMDIPLNVLRIRAHRIRKSLEQCIENCLAQAV